MKSGFGVQRGLVLGGSEVWFGDTKILFWVVVRSVFGGTVVLALAGAVRSGFDKKQKHLLLILLHCENGRIWSHFAKPACLSDRLPADGIGLSILWMNAD